MVPVNIIYIRTLSCRPESDVKLLFAQLKLDRTEETQIPQETVKGW